jgi:hypothetical protein
MTLPARVTTQEAVDDIGRRYSGWDPKPPGTSVEVQDQATWPVRESFIDPGQVTCLSTTSWSPMPTAPIELSALQVGPFASQP